MQDSLVPHSLRRDETDANAVEPKGSIPGHDSWRGLLWTVVIAVAYFWISYPRVYTPQFDEPLRYACIAIGLGVLLSLPLVRVPRPAWSVLCLLILGFTSVLWSINAQVTYSYTLRAALIALLATVVVAYADARTISHGVTLGAVVVLGVGLYAYQHNVPGSHVPAGGERGIAGVGGNRNILAYTLLLALPFAVSFIPRRWWGRILSASATVAILVGLALTQSGTGAIAGFLVVLAAFVLHLTDRRRLRRGRAATGRRWLVPVLALGFFGAAVLALDLVSSLFGKDLGTLTGRVPLWKAILATTHGREWFIGDGWGAVWAHGWYPGPRNPDWLSIVHHAHRGEPHGHNSFMDLLPELGILGMVVFALASVEAIRRALRLRDPDRVVTATELHASRAGLLGVLALFLGGLTEPLSTIPLGWFITVIVATGFVVQASVRPVDTAAAGQQFHDDPSAG